MLQRQVLRRIVFAVLTCFALTTELLVDAQKVDFPKSSSPVYANPDQHGYRHCAYWKLADGTSLFSTCDPYKMNRCGKDLEFEYKCCSGFAKTNQFGAETCASVQSPWMQCPEMLESQDVSKAFVSKLKDGRVLPKKGSYTIFAPDKSGSRGFDDKFNSADLMKLHIVKGRFATSDLVDGQSLETMLPGQSLRVSRYAYGVVCVECMEIIEANMECATGPVHIVRFPLGARLSMPADGKKLTVMEVLRKEPSAKDFAEDLPEDLKRRLETYRGEGDRLYTVIAPQNWAAVRSQFSNDKKRLAKIAASHVYEGLTCSAGLVRSANQMQRVSSSVNPGGSRSFSQSGGSGNSGGVSSNNQDVSCSIEKDDGSVLSPGGTNGETRFPERRGSPIPIEVRRLKGDCNQESRLIKTDLMAINGVVHILEEALVPLNVMRLPELQKSQPCIEHLRIGEFMKTLEQCDLRMKEGEKYAIIVPQDSSFKWWPNYAQFKPEFERFKADPEYRCRVARYHIMGNKNGGLDNVNAFSGHTQGHRSNNINNYLYETGYITKNKFGSKLNFHYSPINDMSAKELDDGTSLYLTPRINIIPERNLTDILAEEGDMTMMNALSIKVDMNENVFKKEAPRNLYLVVKDSGWSDGKFKDNRPDVDSLNKDILQQFLMLHHVKLYLWGGDIGYFDKNSVHTFESSVGEKLTFWMDGEGVMRIGHSAMPDKNTWPKVVRWNIPARDGIIWVLEGPLACVGEVCREPEEDIDKYTLIAAACRTDHLHKNGTLVKVRGNSELINMVDENKNECVKNLVFAKETVRKAAEIQII